MPVLGDLGGGGATWPGPFQPDRGMQGWPQMGGAVSNPLFQMMLSQVANMAMGGIDMVPMGLSNQNMYNRFQAQYFTSQHDQLLKGMAVQDRPVIQNILAGYQKAKGAYGPDQQAYTAEMASRISLAVPFMIEAMPETYDQLTGGKSMALLGSYFMRGGRSRRDSISGRWGMSAPASQELATAVHKQMFGSRELEEAHGMTAGQTGQLFWGLQRQGRMGSAGGLEGLQASDPAFMQKAMDAEGFAGPLSSLGATDRRKLMQQGDVQAKMKSFNAQKVSATLKDWSGAVNAMREIFGDAGMPNAPIPMLLQGLEQLTAGAASQLSPGRVQSMVRNTANLARMSGVGMQGAMAMQQMAGPMAQQMGLDPIFTNIATRGMLSFTAGYKNLDMGQNQAWGSPSLSQVQQAEVQLQLGAAGSQAANQMGAMLRLRRMGVFTKDSNASRYLAAMDAGSTTYQDAADKTQSMDLTSEQYANMISGSTGGQIGAGQALYMTQQTYANQEMLVANPAALHTVRRMQGNDARQRARIAMTGAAGISLAGAGLKDRRGLALLADTLSAAATTAFYDAKGDVASDPEKRREVMAASLRQRLEETAKGTGPAAAAARETLIKAREDPNYLLVTAELMYKELDQSLRETGQGSAQMSWTMHSSDALNAQAEAEAQSQAKTYMQDAMSTMGNRDAITNIARALMDVEEDDEDAFKKVVSAALGGVSEDKITKSMMEPLVKLRSDSAKYVKDAVEWDKENDQEKKAKLKTLLDIRGKAMRDQAQEVKEMFEDAGIDIDTNMSDKKLAAAEKLVNAALGIEDDSDSEGGGRQLVINVGKLVMNAADDESATATGDIVDSEQGKEG